MPYTFHLTLSTFHLFTMKKYLLFLTLFVCAVTSYAQDPAYPAAPAAPQNIVGAEYFIDTDPGIGSATAISITPGVNITISATGINTAGLSNGVHRIGLRTRNTEGRWSSTELKTFVVDFDPAYATTPVAAQNITAAEYFIDADPGIGNAQPISISAAVNVANATATINTVGLTNGVHRLYIRTKSNEGRWSITNIEDFIVDTDPPYPSPPVAAQNIVAAEYFVDTDPGTGNGQAISISPGVNLADVAATVNTAGLTNGVHRLYIRAKNNEGSWSITNVRDFNVDSDPVYPAAPVAPQNIIAAEYFIDTDPGVGNAQAISISAGTDLSNLSASVNTTGLTNGVHRLYVRTKSNEGLWSLTNVRDFNVDSDPAYPDAPAAVQNIIAAEYFVDTDPGPGAGTPIAVTPGADLSNVAASISTAGLSNGSHNLFIRTKNQEGKWSITNYATFFTDMLSVTPDTIEFGNVPTAVTVERELIIKNNSAASQTITAIAIGAAFTANASLPVTINAGKADTIKVSFTPTNVTAYLDSVVLTTSSGKYKTVLAGNGIAQTFSWMISPVTGHNYGNVLLNNSANYTFTIYNKGNVPVTLSNVVTNNSAFVPGFTAGTVIAANGSLALPVVFTPTTAGQHTAQLKILSSTAGIDSATTTIYGNGYTAGTPPVLEYVPGGVYGGMAGVSPAAGPTGAFTYKILYKSASNKAPMTGYPKLSIDLNGNHTFNDLNEGVFTMVKEGNSTDYATGVTYTYTFTHNSNTNAAGYQFDVTDVDGNAATTGTAYKAGPLVTNDVLDLRIFANDISFSNSNPQPGTTFTLTARISNSTAIPATNVPIKFYRDTILIGSAVLPSVPANGSNTINYTLNFADEGFYPIKVWIDSSRTLSENNILNNYAIRPVTVGSPNLPGGITAKTSAIRQECPQLQVLITGSAAYFGTGTNTIVAGAEVTINTGSQIFKTTTDANGNYSTLVTGVTCGSGNFAYAVTVTDFTFTSTPVSNSIAMPCPASNACQPPVPQPSMGGIMVSAGSTPCSNVAGSTSNFDFRIKIRERDINNMWSPFDEVLGATLNVFINGELVETRQYARGLAPGQDIVVIFPWELPQSIDPLTIRAEFVYTYAEYEQIPNTATVRPHYITYHIEDSRTVIPQPSLPDLSIRNFAQTSFTSFSFDAVNLKCVTAGSHVVKIFDGGSLIKTETISSLAGGAVKTISFSDPTLSPGVHTITIVIDADGEITETDETNNTFTFTITVVAPDLSITDVTASPSLMNSGASTRFIAVIKNIGKATGSFNVRFAVNGAQVGAKKNVSNLSENGAVAVTSDAYTVTSNSNTCGDVLEVFVDSDNTVAESSESNNKKSIPLSADLTPFQLPNETGSAANPAIVRVNNTGNFFPAIRNMGIRDAANVQVHYLLNGVEIAAETIANVKAGVAYAAHGAFSHTFSATGDFVVRVVADSLNTVCEGDESNNAGLYHIRVTDSKPDLEVLSQFVSPSSLNPLPAQNITIVGTVRNSGGKVTTPNVMRFFVDDVQLGDDVPFNAIQPGKDTTVQATLTYSSLSQGVKVMKIVVDPAKTMAEENEWNNEATRTLIVGEAPDMAKRFEHSIKFNPNGFSAGDSVTISYSVINNGTVDGAAWVRFMILDQNGGLRGIDSTSFTLSAGANTIVTKKMYFDVLKGRVIAQIVNCTPIEYNMENNTDTLSFSTVLPMSKSLTVNGNLDMKQGIPDDIPGWIGGKLLLEDYDLTVNGTILNLDAAHFIVTNGAGKLKLVNNNTENIFPVAADTSHGNFVKIRNNGTADNFSVRVASYVLQNGASGDTVKTGNVNRTWFIDEQTPGGSDATITFLWNEQDEQPAFDRANSRTAHYTTAWQLGDLGAALTDSLGRFTRVQSGYTSFSPFTVTSVNAALPLRLLKFTATARDRQSVLQWQTTDEVNTSSFEIEHSTDGQRFATIGSVRANNSAGTHSYEYTHRSVSSGMNYYRLKMVDLDGTYTYSAVQVVKFSSEVLIRAYPNPTRQMLTVAGTDAGGMVKVFAPDGKLARTQSTKGNITVIDLGGLPGGVYILQYSNKDVQQQIKIMKQ